MSTHEAVKSYNTIYERLYQRPPKGLEIIDDQWVMVNGARMSLSELQFLTDRLQQEYQETIAQKRSLVGRLVHWFKGV